MGKLAFLWLWKNPGGPSPHVERSGCLCEPVSLFLSRDHKERGLPGTSGPVHFIHPQLLCERGSGHPGRALCLPCCPLYYSLVPVPPPPVSSPTSLCVCCRLEPAFWHCGLPSQPHRESVAGSEPSPFCLRLRAGVRREHRAQGGMGQVWGALDACPELGVNGPSCNLQALLWVRWVPQTREIVRTTS